MIKELTLTQISRFDKGTDGQPYMSKTGKPYTCVRIKAAEYGEQWLSGFGGSWNKDWKIGDQVTVNVEEKPNPKGGLYLNFERVEMESRLLEMVNNLNRRVTALETWKASQGPQKSPMGTDYPEGPDPDEIPF